MQSKEVGNIVLNLKNEMSSITPDVWESIHKKIIEQISNELLQQLNTIPSPKGKLIYEKKAEILERINKFRIYRIGA